MGDLLYAPLLSSIRKKADHSAVKQRKGRGAIGSGGEVARERLYILLIPRKARSWQAPTSNQSCFLSLLSTLCVSLGSSDQWAPYCCARDRERW
jgi:hypothetical protein